MEAQEQTPSPGPSDGPSNGSSDNVWRNSLSIAGAWLAGASVLFIGCLLFLDIVTPTPSPYIGLFTFLLFPALIVAGIALMIAGFLLTRRRLRRKLGSLSRVRYYPTFDFNRRSDRRLLFGSIAGVFALLPFVGVMSYEGYHYTDSNEFCGRVCHAVMAPQYTAHQHSPHARVACAECHIGPGASWYVKSKLSGLRQVLAVMRSSYPKPIPAAIQELRPATETCEQCHWPEKFYGDQLVTRHRFAADEASTARTVRMLVKTGGSDPTTGPPSGIHWHMALSHEIQFVASDEELQEIPWVRSVDHATGETKVFRSDGGAASDPAPEGHRRTMDCMDCHNRATHIFRSPTEAADFALNIDQELRSLPYAKRELVSAVLHALDAGEDGVDRGAASIRAFYHKNHPEIVKDKPRVVERLALAAREIFRTNFFPGMKADWRAYPQNIGHLESPGCFRCHDGLHVDDEGNRVSTDCQTCHEFVGSQDPDSETLVKDGEFVHPAELVGVHGELRCDQCHGGGLLPEATCAGCHTEVASFLAGTSPDLARFEIEADSMDGMAECEDCHDLSAHLSDAGLDLKCYECHEPGEYEGNVASMRKAMEERFATVRSDDPETQQVLELLRRSGPLHNVEAARKVLETLAAEPGGVAAAE